MDKLLPQQRLFLELLVMSGDIAVPDVDDQSMLFRILHECKQARWIGLSRCGAGFDRVHITALGRKVLEKSG